MTIFDISDPDDPRVYDYTRLTDTTLRRRREPAEGMYIAESSKVLRRALAAGHRPRSFFLAEKWLADLTDVLEAYPEVPAFVGPAPILEAITGFHLHRGAMAAMHRPAPQDVDAILTWARRIAVLENIVDHTNIGAIFRCAAALEVDAVLISPQCADPLYRRSIRVSMGSVFQIPWARLEQWPKDLDRLAGHGFTTAALALTDEALSLDEVDTGRYDKLALLLGTEGDGLAASTVACTDLSIRIPMAPRVDSLNVAAAAAVAFWACRENIGARTSRLVE